jgi:hypothetical protein
MDFAIQVCNPFVKKPRKSHFQDLSEALSEVFAGDTEDGFMLWNWVPIRVSYRYDLSVMIDDLLPFLTRLVDSVKGSWRVYWGSNTFKAEWLVYWADGQIRITTHWDSVAGNYEDLLNSRNILDIGQDTFLREWKLLLRKVIEAVEFAQVTVADRSSLDSLYSVERSIPELGRMYALIQ